MEAAIDEIALQETLPINRQEQDEIERSLTEQQWQQELMRQDMDSETENKDTRTPLQKVRDQEGEEIRSRLQHRWQKQRQRTDETEQTEKGAERGGGQYPPTQITRSPKILKQQR